MLVKKERSLFKCWSPEKMGDFYNKALLNIGRGFYKEGEVKQNKQIKVRRLKVPYVDRPAQSILRRT